MDWSIVNTNGSSDFVVVYSHGTNGNVYVDFEAQVDPTSHMRAQFKDMKEKHFGDPLEGFVDRAVDYLHSEKPIGRLMTNEII